MILVRHPNGTINIDATVALYERRLKMGLQKLRADKKGEAQANGCIPFFCNWMGGPTLAKIENCPIKNAPIEVAPRMVYVRGEPDTWFSIPAACKYKGKTITGYITTGDDGCYEFRCHTDQKEKFA